jgi:hypothetical protein
MRRRTLWLLVSAAVIGVAALFIIQWSVRWNKPKVESRSIATGDLRYQGKRFEVSIECSCPPTLIEAKGQYQLTFSTKGPNQTPSPRPPALTPKPVKAPAGPPAPVAEAGQKTIWVSVDPLNAAVELPHNFTAWDIGNTADLLKSGLTKSFPIWITPNGSKPVVLMFQFQSAAPQQGFDEEGLGYVRWKPETHPMFLTAMLPFISAGLVFGLVFGAFFLVDRRLRQLRNRTNDRLSQTHVAWEIASLKLEAYFDRNLIQVNLVFWVAVFVMAVGFGFVLAGVVLSYRNSKDLSTAGLAAISGIITQFIGVTFMVIYRSTMRQANDFMSVLERINTVGMAVHELDRIPDNPPELKNAVRAHVVELLISVNQSPAKGANLKPEERRQPTSDEKV